MWELLPFCLACILARNAAHSKIIYWLLIGGNAGGTGVTAISIKFATLAVMGLYPQCKRAFRRKLLNVDYDVRFRDGCGETLRPDEGGEKGTPTAI